MRPQSMSSSHMDVSDLMASQSGIIDNFKLTRRNLPNGQEIKTPDNNRDRKSAFNSNYLIIAPC